MSKTLAFLTLGLIITFLTAAKIVFGQTITPLGASPTASQTPTARPVQTATPVISPKGMVFCGDHRNIEGLVKAGVDVANLAINHAGSYKLRDVIIGDK